MQEQIAQQVISPESEAGGVGGGGGQSDIWEWGQNSQSN